MAVNFTISMDKNKRSAWLTCPEISKIPNPFDTAEEAVNWFLSNRDEQADAAYMTWLIESKQLGDDESVDAFDRALYWDEFEAEVLDRGYL